ncbi:MAG: hypothetical protein U0U67_08235 [Chitinophagales bacterium]
MIQFTERLHTIPDIKCTCYSLDSKKNFSETYIGVDTRNGRYADITLHTCNDCGATWVRYFAEFEAFSRSGRWYKGIISEPDLKKLKPENAVEYLEKLDWFIFGGSYFSSSGIYGKGHVKADL